MRSFDARLLPLLLGMGLLVPVLALADDCEGDCPEQINCTWADPPCVRGSVYVADTLHNGIQVYVKNKTQNIVYQPYGPDSVNCDPPLPIPETRSHNCPECQMRGQWGSYWETWCSGMLKPPPHPNWPICEGDSILAAAVYEGDTVIVRDQYNGNPYFRMPNIEFE